MADTFEDGSGQGRTGTNNDLGASGSVSLGKYSTSPGADVPFDADHGQEPGSLETGMIHCSTCGARIARSAVTCPKCGGVNELARSRTSNKTMVVAALLCFFFGAFGFHRFYVGKIISGVFMILTLGGLGIWALIDLIMIITGGFKDKQGLPLAR